MTSSRREFLKRGTWMALAAGVPLSLSENTLVLGVTPTSAASGLNKAAFESQLNTKFLINEGASKVAVTLVDVANLGSRKQNRAGKEGFSLLFRGSKDVILQQNTYVIEHETLGMFSFLIVPIGPKGKRAPHYEAVINRLYP
jgi:hypothetical protein